MFGKSLSGSRLKIIAIVSMVIDHFTRIVLVNGLVMQAPYAHFTDYEFNQLLLLIKIGSILGRIAFPIFCFLLVEGFVHTRNFKKYLFSLLLSGVLIEFLYNWVFFDKLFYFGEQNVFFTLSLGLVLLFMIKKYKKHLIIVGLMIVTAAYFSYLLRLDGWYYGILLMSTFYLFRDKKSLKYLVVILVMYLCGLDFTWRAWYDLSFLSSAFSLIIILKYNHQRGATVKYLFYVFYPVHLIVLKGLSVLLCAPFF
ncbi:MAG: TraX family protein [Vagococcus sp.]